MWVKYRVGVDTHFYSQGLRGQGDKYYVRLHLCICWGIYLYRGDTDMGGYKPKESAELKYLRGIKMV